MDIKTNQEEERKISARAADKRSHWWLISYIVTTGTCITLYFLLDYQSLGLASKYHSLLQRLLMAGFIISIVFIITKSAELIVIKKTPAKKIRYNRIRLIHLLSIVVALFIVLTFLFQKWYTAAFSLGLVSLILGFALQTPISSLIGWFYIITRNPFQIGDRIQVGDFTGDVVEIGYLDTTLWEFHGDYLSNDVPSGRLIRFPNTLVLQSEVYNYSWKKFPFIWNEIPFHIAYESDFAYVETTIREVAKKELGEDMSVNIGRFKELLQQTPVDELDIKEYPFVVFRTNANTWIEVSVTYLVAPKKASAIRSQLIKTIVAALLKEPAKVLFPNSNMR